MIGRAKSGDLPADAGDASLTASSFEEIFENGTFEQTGGTHTVNATLGVRGTGRWGRTRVGGRTQRANALAIGSSASTGVAGVFDLSGGSAIITGTTTIGPGGMLNVSSGSLTSVGVTNDAALKLTGGGYPRR